RLGRLRAALLVTRTPPTPSYTLSLHDALPICGDVPTRDRRARLLSRCAPAAPKAPRAAPRGGGDNQRCTRRPARSGRRLARQSRSEEHTSELQSRENLVCRLLLEKKTETQLQD